MANKTIDVVVCLGGKMNDDGTPSATVVERARLAYLIAQKYNTPLILTGKQYHKRLEKMKTTEASAMLKSLQKIHKNLNVEITLEEKGQSTIHQLCIIKKNFLKKNNWNSIGLVTDKLHLPRAKITAEWIFGDDFKVLSYGSNPKLSREGYDKYKKDEEEKMKLTVRDIIDKFKKGDDENILEFDKKVRKIIGERIKAGEPSDKVYTDISI